MSDEEQLELIRESHPEVSEEEEVPPVHDHGPDEGPGLACRERRIFGRLVGSCVLIKNDELLAEYHRIKKLEGGMNG